MEKLPARVSILRKGSGTPAIFIFRSQTIAPSAPACGTQSLIVDELRQSAVDLALGHRIERGKPKHSVLAALREAEAVLDRVGGDLVESLEMEQPLSNSGEWLYDNFHLILAHIAEVRRHLPRDPQNILPILVGGEREFRVYRIALTLVQSSDSLLTPAVIAAFLDGYQTGATLTIAELWIFPLMIRLALIEELARLGDRVSCEQHQRDVAYFWADRLARASREKPEHLDRMIALLDADPAMVEPQFLARLTEQLRDEEDILAILRAQLDKRQQPLAELIRQDHQEQARDRVSVANAIGSLRTLADLHYPALFEKASAVHAVLERDPAAIYPCSDFTTRDRMRRAVEEVARNSPKGEVAVAALAIDLAEKAGPASAVEGHAGYYLIAEGRAQLEKAAGYRPPWVERLRKVPLKHPAAAYLGSVIPLSFLFVMLVTSASYSTGVHSFYWLLCLGILAAFPAIEIAIQIVNALVVTLLNPRMLPKMDFEGGIPQDFSTLVVVPMMLLTPDAIRHEVDKLEVRYLANREPNISFALLSDFTDAPEREMPEDGTLLTVAVEAIEALTRRHPDVRFVLYHRARRWSDVERKWIGWERKRGKLEELNRYLNGEGTVYDRFVWAGTEPENIRFVITLDADTQLPANTARRLIETLAHPLNQVSLLPDGRTRRRGYTIIQPRVSITLPGTTATRFTRLFTETSGTDPYSQAVSDAYQDLFGEGIYHGKAIYDVRAFHRILSGRFPEGLLLSHDLIEGAHVGVGLASDIELFENFPYDYQSHSRRQHRWIRGDWQILSWIFPRVPAHNGGTEPNQLACIERWKVFDNLRRSLTPPASILLLLASWLTLSSPAVWSAYIGLCLVFTSLASLLNRFSLWQQGIYRPSRGIATEVTRLVTAISLLPHQAWISMDAIVRSLYRMGVSHEHLLEWETAESTHLSRAKHFQLVFVQTMIAAGATIVLISVLTGLGLFWEPFPFALLWVTAPQVLRWLNGAAVKANEEPLSEGDRRYLRGAARDTWRYFDDFVGEDSNWLPPDNFQEALRVEVAERTSPTNIGMWLNSLLAAKDFGYLTLDQFAARCAATVDTLDKLERFEGHFLNWYDTRTLAPLNPRYVSTVDSGNLLASLWVMCAGCEELVQQPVLGEEALRGLVDTVTAVRRVELSGSQVSIPLSTLMRLLRAKGESENIAERIRLAAAPAGQLAAALRWSVVESDERSYWFSKLQLQIEAWTQSTARYLHWIEVLAAPPHEFVAALGVEAVEARSQALQLSPSLHDIASGPGAELQTLFALLGESSAISGQHRAWLEEIQSEYKRSKALAAEQIALLRSLTARMGTFADEHRFGFLYDSNRHLFHIGTSVTEAPLHASHYDLLASESRLTSLVAIAKGDVPIEHWQWLGRPYASYASGQLLYSWSGTMFEYLMPNLFTFAYENSLLAQACFVAVNRQIEYGEESGVPWGISESAYSALDARQTYQYRAFGVPGLGLKRGLSGDLVISPYSTMLALSTERSHALDNLRRLEDEGLRGRFGFYESIDYTRNRSREGAPGVIIYAFMAHHQGMSLLAMDNAMHGDVMRRRFHSVPRIKAIESLLFEGVPKLNSLPEAVRDEDLVRTRPDHPEAEPTDRVVTEATITPRVHILGNGSYSVALTNSGGGYSRWKDNDLTRWRADTTRDHWGSFCYLRDLRSDRIWSSAFHPSGKQRGEFTVTFGPDRVEWVRQASGLDCRTEITVSPEADIEIRRMTLTNHTLRSRQIELTTFAEICIAPHAADRAHPAFNKLFIQTEAVKELQAVFASRRPRSPSDAPIWFAESVFGDGSGDWEYETDRSLFLGRGGSAADPAGLAGPLTGAAGTVLDPMFGLRRRLSIDPRSHAQITFLRAAADSREELARLIAKYRSAEACHRAFELAWTHVQLEFRHLGIDAEMAHRFQELASHILYSTQQLRAPSERLRTNRLPQSRMWAHGISGDLPIVAVAISDPLGISLVKEALLAHTFWALRGLKADLLILNQESPSYDRPLHDQLLRLVNAHSLHTGVDQPGGIFLRNWHHIPEEELNLLLASASIYLSPPRTLAQHLGRSANVQADLQQLAPAKEVITWQSDQLPFLELPYFNGLGGFSADGHT
ncbi:MAG: glucoamylase family protein, partial [Acidobacteriota bacterium]